MTTKAERKKQMQQATKRFTASQREKGLMPVHVWVPVEDADRLRKYAEKLRKARKI